MIKCLVREIKTKYVPVKKGSCLGRETYKYHYTTLEASTLNELTAKLNRLEYVVEVIYCKEYK